MTILFNLPGYAFRQIFYGLINSLMKGVVYVLNGITAIFTELFGYNVSRVNDFFPLIDESSILFKYLGIVILVTVCVIALYRSMIQHSSDAENPLWIVVRLIIGTLCIFFATRIFDVLLQIAEGPYAMLKEAESGKMWEDHYFTKISIAWQNALSGTQALQNAEPSFWNEIADAAKDVWNLLTGGGSEETVDVTMDIIWLILMLVLAWQYIKLVLEIVERWMVLVILYFTSPLAFSAIGSRESMGVFKAWLRMVFSQLLLIFFNSWALRVFIDGMMSEPILRASVAEHVLFLLVGIAFLICVQKLDENLNKLGLSAAKTGGALAAECAIIAKQVGNVAKTGIRDSVKAKNGSGANTKGQGSGTNTTTTASQLAGKSSGGSGKGQGAPTAAAVSVSRMSDATPASIDNSTVNAHSTSNATASNVAHASDAVPGAVREGTASVVEQVPGGTQNMGTVEEIYHDRETSTATSESSTYAESTNASESYSSQSESYNSSSESYEAERISDYTQQAEVFNTEDGQRPEDFESYAAAMSEIPEPDEDPIAPQSFAEDVEEIRLEREIDNEEE